MTIKINGDNSAANPGFTGADTDTGLQVGTNELKLVTGGSEAVTVDSSQNVGVGTNSPQGSLHVGSTVQFTESGSNVIFANSGSHQRVVIAAGNNHVTDLEFRKASDTTAQGRIRYDTADRLRFFTAGSERVRIDGGNVGIGTVSPGSTLHVYHATTDTIANFESGDASVAVNFTASDNSMQIATSSTDGLLKNNGAGSLRLFNNGSERMRIASNGDIGIGTTSPAVDLDVSGKIRASTGILFGTDTADANTLDDYEEGTWTMGLASTGNLTSNVGTSTGLYRKVGKNVTVSVKFLLNSSSFSGHSGNVVVTGLPFFGASGTTTQINFTVAYNGVYGRHLINFDMPGTHDYLRVCNSNVFSDPRTVSSIPSGANIRLYFQGHYTLA